jgi:hypothetical protein
MEVDLKPVLPDFRNPLFFFCKFSGRGPFVLSLRDRVDEDENGALVG